jgi:hypothetical protein
MMLYFSGKTLAHFLSIEKRVSIPADGEVSEDWCAHEAFSARLYIPGILLACTSDNLKQGFQGWHLIFTVFKNSPMSFALSL